TNTNDQPNQLQAADLNGDGILDLVTVNGYGSVYYAAFHNTISVLFGNGDGTFQAPVDYDLGAVPTDLAIGDLNGDRHPALVVAVPGAQDVAVLLNNGSGTFGPVAHQNVGEPAGGLYLADFDGDSVLDAVVTSSFGGVGFLKGHGDGTFDSPVPDLRTQARFLESEGPIRGVSENVAPDLNGDGRPDLLYLAFDYNYQSRNYVQVGITQGDGTFAWSFWVAFPGSAPSPEPAIIPLDLTLGSAVLADDLDGDGVIDLIFAGTGNAYFNTAIKGGVSVLLG